jgi:hypothetical protein
MVSSLPTSDKERLRAQRMELHRQTSRDGSAGLRVDKCPGQLAKEIL